MEARVTKVARVRHGRSPLLAFLRRRLRNLLSVIASLYLAVKVGRVSIGTILSAGIVDVFSGEVANAQTLAATLRLARGLSPIRPSGRSGGAGWLSPPRRW